MLDIFTDRLMLYSGVYKILDLGENTCVATTLGYGTLLRIRNQCSTSLGLGSGHWLVKRVLFV